MVGVGVRRTQLGLLSYVLSVGVGAACGLLSGCGLVSLCSTGPRSQEEGGGREGEGEEEGEGEGGRGKRIRRRGMCV